MLTFLLILQRFTRAIRYGLLDPAFRAVLMLVSLQLLFGTLFFTLVEGWRPLDAFYFSVITLATVGYGDYVPKTDAGKLFTVFYIFTGIGLLVLFFQQMAANVVATRSDTPRLPGRRRARPTDQDAPPANGADDPLARAPGSEDPVQDAQRPPGS